jgi:hypothetical protein
VPYLSYNLSGGPMNVTKVSGTTGRYIVTFTGLSAVLGTKNTVHVTEYGLGDTYCKPVNGRLAYDKLEVRCFKASTRAPANAAFTVVVLGKGSNAVFAYANQPTSTDYAPASAGSFSPGGPIRVYREGVGVYRLVFTGIAPVLSSFDQGHGQVNAVGTGKSHCIVADWGSSYPNDVTVEVQCYTPAGAPADSKFNVMFQLRMTHVAFAYAHLPSTASYSPVPSLGWNPAQGNPITITRTGVGDYTVVWQGVDPEIVEGGTVQVTAAASNAQCKAVSLFDTGVQVHCFGPNGAPMDATYSVLLGS